MGAQQKINSGGTSFFAVMAVVIAMIIVAGFGPSYAASLAPPGLPIWVHLHGALMVAWIVLFALQTQLVATRALRLHRRLGWLSIGLVAVIVPLGVATNILAVKRGATPPFFTPAAMMAADLLDLLLFSGIFIAAVLLRRQREWHKRLMLCATVILAWPALGRLVAFCGLSLPLIIPVSTALLIMLALAGPVHDLVLRRRIHPAFMWGVALLIIAQPLHLLVAASAPVQAAAHELAPRHPSKAGAPPLDPAGQGPDPLLK